MTLVQFVTLRLIAPPAIMGAMDKGALYRLAASYLGEAEVVPDAVLCRAFDDVVQQVIFLALDYTQWPFALKVREVLLDDAQMCELPADCLEVRYCSLRRWEVFGRVLVNRGEEVEDACLVYKSSEMADQVSLPDQEPYFCEGVALLLAAKAAPRVTSRFDLAAQLEQRAQSALYRAKLKVVRSHNSNDQVPVTGREEVHDGYVC